MSGPTKRIRKPTDLPALQHGKFDRFEPAVTMIDVEHRNVHDGMIWSVTYFDPVTPSNDDWVHYLLRVPAGSFPHLRVIVFTAEAGPLRWFLYENVPAPTTSPIGTLLTARNANRNIGDDPQPNMSIYAVADADVLAWGSPRFGDADLLLTKYIPSGGNRRTAVQGDDPGEERVLRQDTDYLISLLNVNAGANTQIHAQFLWYELDYGQ